MKTIRVEKPIIQTSYENGTPMTNGFILRSPCHSHSTYFFPYSNVNYINIAHDYDNKPTLTIIMKNNVYIDLVDELPALNDIFYNIISHVSC